MEKSVCEICGEIFTRARDVKRHAAAVHQNTEVQCEKCFKKFNCKDVMEKHKLKCCVCRLCGVDLPNSIELARHNCGGRGREALTRHRIHRKNEELIPGK